MNTTDAERTKRAKEIEDKIKLQDLIKTKQVSNDFLPMVHETIDALALACTFRRPRQFGKAKRLMNCDDFIRIADNVSFEQIAVAVNALQVARSKVENRAWYILGILAQY